MPNKIKPYEGRPVIGTPVAITHAGDGLSKAMAVEATDLPIQSTVYVVLECRVGNHVIAPENDSDPNSPLVRKQTLKAGRASFVDVEAVATALDETAKRIREHEGRPELFDGDEE